MGKCVVSETWKPIPGYEGYYEASSLGRVKSLPWVVQRRDGISSNKPGRVLRPFSDGRYMKVKLCTPGSRHQSKRVHRLVMQTFCGETPEGMVICHTDGDPTNNSLVNLRFGTGVDNAQDTILHGRNHYRNKTHCKRNHEFNDENTRILRNGKRECLPCKRFLAKRYREYLKSVAA